MDNHERRVNYVMQNRRVPRETAEAVVTAGYMNGTTDAALFKPGQRRRLSRGGAKARGGSYPARRARRDALRLPARHDEAARRTAPPALRATVTVKPDAALL